MRVDLFDFDLPRDLIAVRPAVPRDSARLLLVEGESRRDLGVGDLPGLLDPGDILVFNDTRVIPARLKGRIGDGGVEVTLHKRVGPDAWDCFARPARKLKPGVVILFAEGFTATVAARGEDGEATLRFDRAGAALMAALEAYGHIPLPPYIKRPDDARDRADYQTIYAREDGAVAAPTAGLHFTPALLAALEARGVSRAMVTLHVGAGTFLPVKVEDTDDHRMHAETGTLTAQTAEAINAARAAGGKVVAVGTTAMRLLESATGADKVIRPFHGDTSIFITPGYRFNAVDRLMTNFHLPRSTLFMLVSAFAGASRMRNAYAHAISQGYRFYSYGDSSLLSHAEDPR
ncbi:tRNA preQ1(34) S-adenosylmethionine ribosyltransferase-isomerase QueA [Rhodospirillum rubrum]|uniref:S-adenosylmethionine:tRNA ribosyltransferase-isomerase n=1 Tax=Rhodospirillum rubrum (strain ATCC 11170 / ATH 1.1.1 / DSM 467 / LMG 4362 / NCIMB 8255 / S1) TaxID=269796 RepID=QUEA_RHORT|nr:tRNA preQ1(34) S-adenosylmethionine ribosyltransferase-isomerase QueA [Rhodospirillum rubrum]Q2RXQ9.1 RecName: Full=S-adenosylmethionine:tRNA ribosyltransferase-isomerase; AltName: Full=Queuosine biosynthesis protein QueA [Rhodospirillum rubrum ATCC 11170]ABC21086.1 Queuosine biosynthesis protein [Rhodospirillum rubrum ATCC 11170]AEO46754.1 queuosine biosynthesis protein [Rhodospirillum rubrum F11]MBK5952630.1 tRNA preQ1(34) S-adenosylmethionine ribosyltransferase-isomerase QueA [Rhodospiril